MYSAKRGESLLIIAIYCDNQRNNLKKGDLEVFFKFIKDLKGLAG